MSDRSPTPTQRLRRGSASEHFMRHHYGPSGYVHPKYLMACPFCGGAPTIEPWHGGAKTKRMVSCVAEDCHANPRVTGRTPKIARERWNRRAT